MPVRPPVTSALYYEDVAAALDFLESAFGLETNLRVTDEKGAVVHAEMSHKDGRIMLGPGGWSEFAKSPKTLGGANTQNIHLQVEDVAAHCAQARQAGAKIVAEPSDQFYGDRIYRALDGEGHHWTFSQHIRDVSTEEMNAATGLIVDMKP
ncbi:MAG TPA: VOC family protein [Aliidongia sp.]|nr:VOC family protein [Aliidongia sp.]